MAVYNNGELQSNYADWQKSLLEKKEDVHKRGCQEELLSKIENTEDFYVYLVKKLRVSDEILNQCESPTRPWTAGEFLNPPEEREKEIYEIWKGTTKLELSAPLYWTVTHLRMMRDGFIESQFLLDRSSSSADGSDEDGTVGEDKSDKYTRAVIRHLGGVLPFVRGYVSVFTDCFTSRAYWRVFIAKDIAATLVGEVDFGEDAALKTLHSKNIWRAIAECCVSRLTILNNSRIRAAIVFYLTNHPQQDKKGIDTLFKTIGQYSVGRHFDYISFKDLMEMIDNASSATKEKLDADKKQNLESENDSSRGS